MLVALVVRDGLPWLRDCLQALSAQSHPRLAVIAVDVGSTDGSGALLEQALGAGRVLTVGEGVGLAGAVRAALELPVASAADYLLILHDDTALGPDAVARMVEAAEGIHGVERVGVVGPKVVDWDDPRILREVGRSTDRLGHPYTSLVDGEMDQGQYDRVLEVLYVSSCAMLVSRETWQRTGLLDERFGGHHDDLDFCWRARVAGFRVLMTPLAQARHRGAAARGERRGGRRRSAQYYAERAALASMLKNYGALSLAWLVPLHVLVGIVRLAYMALARRFEDAWDLLSGWTWNLVHLPSTLRRRVRAQSVRSARDGTVRRFMQSALFRVPRWFQAAERILEEQLEEEREDIPLRARASSLAAEHPALVSWTIGIGVAVLAYMELLDPRPLEGGALAMFPDAPSTFFRELAAGIRSTGLGGGHAASPALAVLGGLSAFLAGSTAVAQKAILMALPPIAAILLYRGVVRQTGQRSAAAIASGAFVLSGIALWSFSQGRIGMLVALAVLPVVSDRLDQAFDPQAPPLRLRFVVALGAIAAAGVAFLPGIVPALGLLAASSFVFGRRRIRGSFMALVSALVGAALVFPLLPDLVRGPGATLGSHVGETDFWLLTRLAPSPGAGAWAVAWFLPVAALVSFAVVGPQHRRRAWQNVVVAVAGLFLAWASAAGYLPDALSNPPAYLAVTAVAEASVLAFGLATIGSGIERHAFGYRQIAAALVALVLVLGGAGQVLAVALGRWEIDANALPSAWPAISTSGGSFRVLWLGGPAGGTFPAPGGDPQGVLEAGGASVRYAITDRDGISALDVGRGPTGAGYAYVRRALSEIVAGRTSHGGAMLAPLAVRFLVAEVGDLPQAVRARLDAQVDLDLEPAGGLVIYRNARALGPAIASTDERFGRTVGTDDLDAIARMPSVEAGPLEAAEGGWRTEGTGGTVFVAEEFDDGWKADPGGIVPFRAFGWAIASPPGTTALRFDAQWVRTVELAVLAALWLAVLWITRRPVSR